MKINGLKDIRYEFMQLVNNKKNIISQMQLQSAINNSSCSNKFPFFLSLLLSLFFLSFILSFSLRLLKTRHQRCETWDRGLGNLSLGRINRCSACLFVFLEVLRALFYGYNVLSPGQRSFTSPTMQKVNNITLDHD